LHQIIFKNQKNFDDDGRDCLLNVDGIDCPTTQQGQEPNAFYSHKFDGPGLRYEVATDTHEGNICHLNGPFPPGDWPDLSIFRHELKEKLDEGERCNADDGYGGEDPSTIVSTRGIRFMEEPKLKYLRQRLRNRHETCNERIKHFRVLKLQFHHPLYKHSACFRACAVFTQLSFTYDKKLFNVSDATTIANSSDPEEARIAIYEAASTAIEEADRKAAGGAAAN